MQEYVDTQRPPVRLRATVFLLIIYVWWYFATPFVRFPILGDIHFERILVALIIAGIFLGGRITARPSPFNMLIPALYVWMLISFLLSPYRNIELAGDWLTEYWKVVVLYYLTIYSVRDRNDFYCLLVGISCVSLLYQVHSWNDFLAGGSYVYQQGMKRMIGVWSGGGLGAPNAWGVMALYSIPFGVLVHNITTNRRMKFAMRMLLALSGLSILFSGTRGALVGLTFILMIYLGRWVLRPGVLISLGLLLSVGYALLPEEYKHRYSLILIDDETELETASDVDAAESAQGRIEGLVDGWHLLLKRPVTGYGPGVSALARLEVRERPPVEDSLLQLHNLYGQIMAELGVPGSLLFIGMIVVYFRKLTRAKIFAGMPGSQESDLAEFIKALRMLMLILLFYGLFTHSLYRYYWMLLFACHNILVNVVGEGRNLTARRAGAAPHSGSRH